MPPKSKKSKVAKGSSSGDQVSQTNTLAHYFSKGNAKPTASTSHSASSVAPVKPKPKDFGKDEIKSSKRKKNQKENATLAGDILDLTMEADEPTAVHIDVNDVLDLTLVDDDEVMAIDHPTKPLLVETEVSSLSDLLEISRSPRPMEIVPTPTVSRAPSPVPSSKPTHEEEEDFMARLLQTMEPSASGSTPSTSTSCSSLATPSFSSSSTYVSTAPTSRTSSVQSITSSTPAQLHTQNVPVANDVDMTEFLAGSDQWNLDDIVLTPVKPRAKYSSGETSCAPKLSPKLKGKQKEVEVVNTTDEGLRRALLEYKHSRDSVLDPAQEPCMRCTVDAIEDEYDYDAQKWRKTLTVRPHDQGHEQTNTFVYLYDDWFHLDVAVDDVINVIGLFTTGSPQIQTRAISLTTTSSNLIILHPDILLTATTLSSAPNCARRPLLASLLRDTTSSAGRATPALVYGSLLHIVAQKALVANDWSLPSLHSWIEEAVTGPEGLTMLLSMGEGMHVARRDVTERAKGLVGFGSRYMSSSSGQKEPGPESALSDTRAGPWSQPARLRIEGIVDVEEEIWSPRWGMKGKIDATVLGTLYEPAPLPGAPRSLANPALPTTATLRTLPLPLELKTGRASTGMEHRAQTMLYTLLLSERYGVPVKDGLLFYTQKDDGEVVRVPRGWNEIKGLVNVRNGVASWIWKRIKKRKGKGDMKDREAGKENLLDIAKGGVLVEVEEEGAFLPAPVDQEWLCKKCYTLSSCLLFRRTHADMEDHGGVSRTKPVPAWLEEDYIARTGHITNAHAAFFKKWERLLSLEERDAAKLRSEIWSIPATDREKWGRCLGGLVLTDKIASEDDNETKKSTYGIRRFSYAFRRALASERRTDGPSVEVSIDDGSTDMGSPSTSSLLNGSFNVGDPVVISAEPDLLALAQGFILDLTMDRIVVGMDHEISDGYARTRLVGRGVILDDSTKPIFRIDKDELSGSMARVRNNLAQLFYVDGEKRQRELVVDLRPPVFDANADTTLRHVSSATRSSSFNLNSSQQEAMRKVLSADDYALILGMPGTGKTTVIAALIHELVKRGKTVLLSSYTHSAVDTILSKVIGSGNVDFGILRLGNVDKVHPSVREYTLDARRQARTVEELERQLCSPPVVATTCLSVEHALFTRRKFDYCIVDEASQITLPTCLGPIRFADKFVLVGDHFQLPPLVKNPIARAGGLDISLFKRLSEAHPSAVVDLCDQYRMNEDIMMLSNKLIYSDRLRCGSEEVAQRSLEVPQKSLVLERLHKGTQELAKCKVAGEETCWIGRLLDESTKAVFVDTDLVPAMESRVGNLVQNLGEASMIWQLVRSLVEGGIKPSQIGVLSLYRQQVKVLQHLLEEVNLKGGDETERVEVLTTDRSQGRDKDCIIISLVRSNAGSFIGDLVRDWRRMNVAFTRARKKLVIFGSRKTLQGEPLLAEFFGLMEGKGWIIQPGQGADVVHEAAWKGDKEHRTPVNNKDSTRPSSEGLVGSRKRMAEDDSGLFPRTPMRGLRDARENGTPRSASMPLVKQAKDSLGIPNDSDSDTTGVKGVRPTKRPRVTPDRTGGDVLRDLNW